MHLLYLSNRCTRTSLFSKSEPWDPSNAAWCITELAVLNILKYNITGMLEELLKGCITMDKITFSEQWKEITGENKPELNLGGPTNIEKGLQACCASLKCLSKATSSSVVERVMRLVALFFDQLSSQSIFTYREEEFLEIVLKYISILLQELEIPRHVSGPLLISAESLLASEAMNRVLRSRLKQRLIRVIVKLHLQHSEDEHGVFLKYVSVYLTSLKQPGIAACLVLGFLNATSDEEESTQCSSLTFMETACQLIIKSHWRIPNSSGYLEFLRELGRSLCFCQSKSTEIFLSMLLRCLFQLSWCIKSEKYTVFVFKTLQCLYSFLGKFVSQLCDASQIESTCKFLDAESVRPVSSLRWTHLRDISFPQWLSLCSHPLLMNYIQITELSCQLALSSSLVESYKFSLVGLLEEILVRNPSVVDLSWFDRIYHSRARVCDSLLPLTVKYAERENDWGPFNNVCLKLLFTADRVRSKYKVLEFVRLLALENTAPIEFLAWKCSLIGASDADFFVRKTSVYLCLDLLRSYGGDSLTAVLRNCQQGLRAQMVRLGLLHFVYQTENFKQLDAQKQIRQVVDKMLNLGEVVLCSQIVGFDGDLMPRSWIYRGLLQALNPRTTRKTRYAWFSMIHKALVSLDAVSLRAVDNELLFSSLFIQLKTGPLGAIEDVGAILAIFATRRSYNATILRSQLLLLTERISKTLASDIPLSSQEFKRLILIVGCAPYWKMPDSVVQKLFLSLIRRSEMLYYLHDCQYIVFKVLVHLCAHYKNSLDAEVTIRYFENIANIGGRDATLWISYWILKNISYDDTSYLVELIRCWMPLLLDVVRIEQSILSLQVIKLAKECGLLFAGDYISILIPCCFSDLRNSRELSLYMFEDACIQWPSDATTIFPQEIKNIKNPKNIHFSCFSVLWRYLRLTGNKRQTNLLLDQLVNVMTRERNNIDFLKLVTRGLSQLDFKLREVERLQREMVLVSNACDDAACKETLASFCETLQLRKREVGLE